MKLNLKGDTLQIELGWHLKLMAFHFSALEIPLSHIERVSTELRKTHWKEIRAPGTYIPCLLKAGTYRRKGRKDFWCVTRGQPVLRLDLKDEHFDSLTLGLEDKDHWATLLSGRS